MFVWLEQEQGGAAAHHRLSCFRGHPVTCLGVRGEGFVLSPPGASPRAVLGAGQSCALGVLLSGSSAISTSLCPPTTPI